MLYKQRRVRTPQESCEIFTGYLGEVYREYFVIMFLDTNKQPTNVHIGSLDTSLVHTREVMKTVILSNVASIICCHLQSCGGTAPSSEDIDVKERLAGDR